MACFKRLTCSKSRLFCATNKVNPSLFSDYFSRKFVGQSVESSPTEANDVPSYPPIKPRYPPGTWGDFSEKTAWLIHDESHRQLRIPRVKERLEDMAGDKGRFLWIMSKIDKRMETVDFKQFITKTHLVSGLPADVYGKIDVDAAYSRIKSLVPELILQECEFLHKHKLEKDMNRKDLRDEKSYITHRLLGTIIRAFMISVMPSHEHLLRCQVDEDVRIETFWHAGGFSGEDKMAKGKRIGFFTKDGVNHGMLTFQYKTIADWQIRSEMPLPEFISQDDPICREGFIPTVDYAPSAAGMVHIHDRPITVSGHWIGDPCEFGLLQVHVLPTEDCQQFKEIGEKYLRTAELSCGLAAGFGSCLSQAYNQGFSDWLELTYPLTSQCVTASENEVRFFAYQLNTTQMWNRAKTIRNILWYSQPMKMFEAIENGQVKGLNEEAFKMLMKFVVLQPADRGHDLRPYLPEDESPLKKSLYINFKGQEPLPVKKIGRWEYPKNAVYF